VVTHIRTHPRKVESSLAQMKVLSIHITESSSRLADTLDGLYAATTTVQSLARTAKRILTPHRSNQNAMSRHLLIATALTAASLAGCSLSQLGPYSNADYCYRQAIDEAPLLKQLETARNCCTSYKDLPYQPVIEQISSTTKTAQSSSQKKWNPALPTDEQLLIGQEAPIFTFAAGRSRFAALDIRAVMGQARVIKLAPGPTMWVNASGFTAATSQCQDPGPPVIRRVFRPLVTFLNKNFEPVLEGDRGTPSEVKVFAAWKFDIPAQATYIIVHSDPREYGSRIELQGKTTFTTIPVGTSPLLVPMEIGGPVKGLSVSTGQLSLTLE
jgi:hypothetical protein